MSRTLMKHVRVLLVAVALVAMVLAILPGVANAAANLDGKVDAALNDGGGDGGTNRGDGGGGTNKSDGGADGGLDGGLKGDVSTGDGGGNLGDAADRVLNSDTTADSVTDADQQVNLNDQPQVDGDTFSNTEVNNPAVPASGEAKADGNGELDGPVGVNEGVCVSGAVNESASDCGGASGSLGDTVTTPDINANLDNTTADSDTTIDQQVSDDPLRFDGNTISNADVNAPAVPASAIAEFDGNVTEGDTLSQDVGVCGTLNAENCGGNTAPDGGAGIDFDEPVGGLGDTTANSDTTIDENINPDNLQQDGAVDNTTDVDAPAVPASGTANFNGNATVGDTVNQGASFCGTLNAENCGGDATPAPDSGSGGIDLNDPLADFGDIDANSVTTIDQQLNDDPLQSNGTVDNTNDIDAPAVPASGTVKIDGNDAVGDTLNQGASSCTDLNAAGCGGEAAPAPDSDTGIDLGDTIDLDETTVDSVTNTEQQVNDDPLQSNGNTTSNTDVDAPTVPASATAELNGNGAVGDTLNQDVGVCGTLNAENCGGNTAPDGGAGSSPAGDEAGDEAGSSPAGDEAPDPDSNAGSNNNNADNGSGSGNGVDGGNDGNPGDSGGSNPADDSDGNPAGDSDSNNPADDSGELAFAAPADSTGSGDGSGSDGSGSANNSDEPASSANPFERGSQTLAANPPIGRTFVALSTGSSGDRSKASASFGSKTKSGELPDTGGITPLVLVAGLLFIGGGLLLVTKRRRFDS